MNGKFKFIVEKTATGFSAYAKDDNIAVGTTGSTITELKSNIVEAMNLYREELNKKPVTEDKITITFDLQQFFEYYKVINASAFSNRIRLNPQLLNQYVKGSKEPSAKQLEKINTGLKELGKELMELEFA
ncbi:MAG TPA: XRE family transcriptional regulator [Sphingobacteriaceae bacterium]|nr:XRE family transcriptional regulator [Sphingobacteriaceae bacterium]